MAGKDNSRPTDAEQRVLLASAEALRGAADLSALLGNEYASLRQGDLEALQKTTTPKQQLIAQLDHLGEDLRRNFGRLGIAFEANTIAAWLTATNNALLQRNLGELKMLLESCRHQNRINGALMEALKGHAHRAVQVLSGECSREQVYSALGESRPLLRSRYTATV
jgi:flagellar biosynthesis/type III secretory pathway chaperone